MFTFLEKTCERRDLKNHNFQGKTESKRDVNEGEIER